VIGTVYVDLPRLDHGGAIIRENFVKLFADPAMSDPRRRRGRKETR
jgi:hypothetical protein